GDSTLLETTGGHFMLTDAGPDAQVVSSLEKVAGSRRYIDIAVITHPQRDHYHGFNFLAERYRFGSVLYNGNDAPADYEDWRQLKNALQSQGTLWVPVAAGDHIKTEGASIDIVSPDGALVQSAEPNDTGVVQYIKTPGFTALLTADIDGW